ncbi:Di-copper centre-containing protein [Sporormia fimetaria CBS 119925]|uniref:tyrosinase n=1 Tax=Sporormia fimetaria CBS 119925 TaxID=1340428 RepID=A0A6A6VI08_9PLEO|nr:Di-copper centre-containing protein [Sporormia fimetaria CBS 119925]
MIFSHSLSALAALAALSSVAVSSPVDTQRDSVVARQNDYFVIKGVTEGGVQPRLNIRDLSRKPENKEMWALFVLALQRLQEVKQSDKASYYSIAGIHGQPFVPWDNVPSWSTNPEEIFWGYCPHNGNLFATWHRPYMMLIEQLIHSHAVKIADEIPSSNPAKRKYRDAASKLRLPYWDWAERTPQGDAHSLPSVLMDDTVSITFPNGTAAQVANPVRRYKFNPLIPSDFPQAGMFKSWQPFNKFSNNNNGYDWAIGNLELVHGDAHVDFFLGHMTFSTVAAFDPIFWLHHSGVDRQLALWQAIYPGTYVETGINSWQTTYSLKGEEPAGADTPLHPFRRDASGQFWTSNLVRDVTKLGYTYPELVGRPSNATLVAKIKSLYDDGAVTRLQVAKRQDDDENAKTSRDWNVHVKLVPGYRTTFSLGNGEYVGSFSSRFQMGMGKDDVPIDGLVSLSSSIASAVEEGKLPSADEKDVVEFLKKELSVKVEDAAGNAIAPAEVPKLDMEVFSQLQTVPKSEGEFPTIVRTDKYADVVGV